VERAMNATVASRGRRLVLPRLSRRTMIVVAVLLGILALVFLWVRQSSLVAVRHVRVTGLYGPHTVQIRQALVNQALTMSTLDVDTGALESAVRGYPDVYALKVSSKFPHGLTIAVTEHVPLATIEDGGQSIAVDRSGELLRGRSVNAGALPTVPLRYQPGGDQLVTMGSKAALMVLAAAPYAFLVHVQSATSTAAHGVIVQLRHGPQVYFGATDQLAEKWAATLSVLANSTSAGAAYIDVTDPAHPGAGASGSTGTDAATSTTTSTTASSTSVP
jgi:cell division septal protein FtsQ